MLRLTRRVRVIAAGAALATAVGTVGWSQPAHAAGQEFGSAYVWAHDPTAASYTPVAAYQWNSVHPFEAVNRVNRVSVGVYRVLMKDLLGTRGTVSVTAYGTSSSYCNVGAWFPVADRGGTSQQVEVRCFTHAGNPADSRFTVSYTNRASTPFPMAYVWADQPFTTDYTPHPFYRFSSSGSALTILRAEAGFYFVRLPGFGTRGRDPEGIATVTAYGPGSARCHIGTGPGGIDAIESVSVACTTPSGRLVDSQFTLTYVEDGNPLGAALGASGHDSAYVRVAPDGSAFPSFAFPRDGSVRSERLATGSYRVRLPVDLRVGHVQVSAARNGDLSRNRCKVASWNASEGVLVRCFGPNGRPANVDFHLTFVGPSRG